MNDVLVQGLLLIEHAFPMPSRLGVPLAPDRRRGIDADPVVLIGGFANAPSGWDEWRRSLEADGFQVFVFDPPTVGLGDMEQSAVAAAAFIADVRRRTGRRKVDVIGFSEGGLLARIAVARLGMLGGVDRLISLATPAGGVEMRPVYDALRGFRLLLAATPPAAIQLLEGSELLRRIELDDRALRTGRRVAEAPRYASIFSRTWDMVVTPWSGQVAGATNIAVAGDSSRGHGPSHFGMFHTSDHAYEAARLLLLDAPEADAVAAGRGDAPSTRR